MKPSPSGSKIKKTQDEMSTEIASFAAKRKEALERAEKLREERKALQRQREVFSTPFLQSQEYIGRIWALQALILHYDTHFAV
jgi:hypothetical protein